MLTTSPLQILLFRNHNDDETLQYEDAVVRALQGGKGAGNYLATGEDLGVQLQVFAEIPPISVAAALDSFCHTLAVVLVDVHFLKQGTDSLWDWLRECWIHTRTSKGRHAMLVLPMFERIGDSFVNKRSEFGQIQLAQVWQYGERAIRPAMFGLHVLHYCRLLLARALPPIGGRDVSNLRLFISHAKMDGLPLAHALKKQIESFAWLQKFYDVDDLPAGCDWQHELEQGVGSSLIIMLRTEHYDSRHWCQQEVLWADEYATPAVLVDARTELNHPGSVLPFDRVPTVRIPDGNLLRILFLALREGLRFLHFMRRVKEMQDNGELPTGVELRVFSYQPGMSALLRACRSLAACGKPGIVLYPDPPLRSGLYEAAQALVHAYAPAAKLLTPNTLSAIGSV
jgi:hypothetical protein